MKNGKIMRYSLVALPVFAAAITGVYVANNNVNTKISTQVSANTQSDVDTYNNSRIPQSEMEKFRYRIGSESSTEENTISNLDIYYVMDGSGSRDPIIFQSTNSLMPFADGLDKNSNGIAFLAYPNKGNIRETLFAKNTLGTDAIQNHTVDLVGRDPSRQAPPEGFSNLGRLGIQMARNKNERTDKQIVLFFESDFLDYNAGTPEDFLNGATIQALKDLGAKVVLIGDNFTERTLTPIEDGFSYKISTKNADGSILDRAEIIKAFSKTTKTTKSSSSSMSLSTSGTSYVFSDDFINKLKAETLTQRDGSTIPRWRINDAKDFVESNSSDKEGKVDVSFTSIGLKLRNPQTRPQDVEEMRVCKQGAFSSVQDGVGGGASSMFCPPVQIIFTSPQVKERQRAKAGELPQASSLISNITSLPNGIAFRYKDANSVGSGEVAVPVIATYPDGLEVEVMALLDVHEDGNTNTARYDKTALQNLVNSVPSEKQAIREDAAVIQALSEANVVLRKDDTSQQEIDAAKQKLEDAIRDARARVTAQEGAERDRQAEAARQDDARRAVERARQALDLADINTAKQKVALVQDPAVKAELSEKIKEIEDLVAKRTELEDAIRRGEQTNTDGMTQESKDALKNAIDQGRQKLADKATDISGINKGIQDINDAINGLKVDKTALKDSIRDAEGQPDHIKEAVKTELKNAQDTDANNSATSKDVKDAKDALDNAVQNAIKAEKDRQDAARNAINDAKRDGSPDSIKRAQDLIDQVQDPEVKRELQNELDEIKKAMDEKNRQNSGSINAPNTGHHKHEVADINIMPIIATLVGFSLFALIMSKTRFRKVKF